MILVPFVNQCAEMDTMVSGLGIPLAISFFKVKGDYSAQLVMVCQSFEQVEKKVPFLELSIDRLRLSLEQRWLQPEGADGTMSQFLSRLLEDDQVKKGYLERLCSGFSIPAQGNFKLYAVTGFLENFTPAELSDKLNATLSHCFSFPCNSNVVVLYLPSADQDSDGSAKNEQLLHSLIDAYGVEVGLSDVFTSLRNERLAYCEALIALQYGRRLSKSLSSKAIFLDEDSAVYDYKLLFPYYVADSRKKGPEFLERYMKYGHLPCLVNSLDIEEKQVLALYAALDFDANLAAEKLFVHKNTVRYRLGRIEKKLHLDFSCARTKHLLSILHYILEIRTQAER